MSTSTKIAALRKVMTAAWTIRRKELCNMSDALRKAWAWAKKQVASGAAKLWTRDDEYFRVYIGDAYVAVSVKAKQPRGYYQRHRACKGEQFATGWVKAVGMDIAEGMALASQFSRDIAFKFFQSIGGNLELLPSKF